MPAKTNSTSYNCFTKSNWITPRLIPSTLKAAALLGAPGLDLLVRENHNSPRTAGLWWDPILSPALGHRASHSWQFPREKTLPRLQAAQHHSTQDRLRFQRFSLSKTNPPKNLHPAFDTPGKRNGNLCIKPGGRESIRNFWIAGWRLGRAGNKIRVNKYISWHISWT